MRRHAANIFNHRRRGEWNPLLLVMFALLTVAPSVLAAAPLNSLQNQPPQVVWQWLQSPEGAPTRELIQQTLLECGVRNAECGTPESFISGIKQQIGVDSPLPHSNNSAYNLTALDEAARPFLHSALRTPPSTFEFSLSSHEAAFLNGIRTNRRRN